ncbi:MAG: hypothetical protein D6679_03350 [Candidatus Hydrogenedentota bacterium]|nr:MAG: hypothetical protein D6679_03350 [Candidatus Hydrogenedentota bacterium]
MQTLTGLVSPADILGAVKKAQRSENLSAEAERIRKGFGGAADEKSPFEEILLEMDPDLFRPEKALFSVMDADREEQERRRRDEVPALTKAFDAVIGSSVAGALGGVLGRDPRYPLFRNKDPFQPANLFSYLNTSRTKTLLDSVQKAVEENDSDEEKREMEAALKKAEEAVPKRLDASPVEALFDILLPAESLFDF